MENEIKDKKLLEDAKNKTALEVDDIKKIIKDSHPKIIKVLKRYCDLDERYYNIIALWIMGTYFHSNFLTYNFLYFNAMRGCLPKGTLIKTLEGNIPIEKINKVLSYNFETKKIESNKAIPFYSGKKKVIKIHLKSKIIECSPEHKWFVKTKSGIELKETKDLNTTDTLILMD